MNESAPQGDPGFDEQWLAERKKEGERIRQAVYAATQAAPSVAVPLKFLQGFLTLAHNYSLEAIPPDYYRGVEGDAFKAAYRRCGQDLAALRAMVLNAAPTVAAPAGAQKP